MENERKRIVDGFTTLQGGVNEGRSPTLLSSGALFSANQSARLINATVRGGYATCRPPVVRLALYFQDSEQQAAFEDHNVQGRYIYQSAADASLIYSIGGRIFRVDPDKRNAPNVMELTPAGDQNPSVRPRAWMEQAEQYLVIQDGQSAALIYDGSTCRRSNFDASEVPTGTAMAYGLGRLVVVLPTKRAYVVGDILGGGTEVIQFTEDSFLNEGGSINVPIPGDITAVKIGSQIDRSVGQGDLIVFTKFGADSARIGENRTTWKDIQFQLVTMLGAGAVSHNSVSLVNGDLFLRAVDGIRSMAMTRSEFNNSWSTTPLSREVSRTLLFDTPALLDFCESALFDNRLLTLCNQNPIPNGCYHTGIIALNFDLISSMNGKSPPVYDGFWKGLNFTSIVAGRFPTGERCFVTHRNSKGKNEVWEVMKTGHLDNNVNRIQWTIEGASLLRAGSTPQSLKSLDSGDISLEKVVGQVDVAVQYKPDQAPCWFDWRTFSVCAKEKDCSTCAPQTFQPQYRTKKRFPQPKDECSASDNKPARLGFSFQPRITITGKATVNIFRMAAIEAEEPTGLMDGCDDE